MPPNSAAATVVPLSNLTKIYLAVVCVQGLALLGLTWHSYRLDPSPRAQFYGLLIGLASLFHAYFGFDAVLTENAYELGNGLVTFAIGGYLIGAEWLLPESMTDGWVVGRGIVVAASLVANLVLSYHVWSEFGWRLYKWVGSNAELAGVYARYQILAAAIKLDWFLQTLLLLTASYLHQIRIEWTIDGGLLVFNSVWSLVLFQAARAESRIWFAGALATFAVPIAFAVSKIYRYSYVISSLAAEYLSPFVILAVATVAARLATTAAAIRLFLRFGHGLAELLASPPPERMASGVFRPAGVGRSGHEEEETIGLLRRPATLPDLLT